MRRPDGLAKRIECFVPQRARRDPAGVKDEARGDLVVLILFGGEIYRAYAVLRGHRDQRRNVVVVVQVGDRADNNLRLERHARCRGQR